MCPKPVERRHYSTYPPQGGTRALPVIGLNVIYLDKGFIDNPDHPLSCILRDAEGEARALSCSLRTDQNVNFTLDAEGSGRFPVLANERVLIQGPMRRPGILTTAATAISLVFGVYREGVIKWY